jgi:hypothetical protein
MATPQLSPGVLIREVDQTVGRADNVLDNIGAIAGPFEIGPVNEPIDITTERQLISVFGRPLNADGQYEYWMSASSYLSYGGVLKVVRTDSNDLVNANVNRAGVSTTTLKIRNFDHYNEEFNDETQTWGFAAKNPGTWANNLKVCLIDDKADQILVGINTEAVVNTTFVGVVTSTTADIGISTTLITDVGSTTGIVLGQFVKPLAGFIGAGTTVVGISTATGGTITISQSTLNTDTSGTDLSISFGSYTSTTVSAALQVGYGVTQSLVGTPNPGIGTTSVLDGYLKGIITGIGNSQVEVRVSSYVAANGTETKVDYQSFGIFAFSNTGNVAIHTSSTLTSYGSAAYTSQLDWYDQQTLDLVNSTIYWKSLAPKPTSSRYALERNGKNDSIHVVVIDDTGSVTGIQGNLLEKHLFLSKASDAISSENSPLRMFWRDYIATYSSYVYAGEDPSNDGGALSPASDFSSGFTGITTSSGTWNQPAQGVTFNVVGNLSYNLTNGANYSANDGYITDLASLKTAYDLFSNEDEIQVDYLIMGPGLSDKTESQAKAAHLMSIANQRKDCVAVVSPHKSDVVNISDTNTQTENVLAFFSPLPSTSYAVFDSGYKYTFDRFNNKFRWIPCNPDVAGLMTRTSIVSFPWFSPAGQQRGILNNAIKLAYNPSKAQRDQLYSQRINSIINQPGVGILLFGDKTALGYSSAFDRINVRRLFLTIEQSLRRVAQAQLFELNDEFTRANFRNAVEPFLRDVEAKRGLYGSLVVCDTSNNTPDIIDNNEFRADIYLKPTKSINYVTLTFVATRSGVSFQEIAGSV